MPRAHTYAFYRGFEFLIYMVVVRIVLVSEPRYLHQY